MKNFLVLLFSLPFCVHAQQLRPPFTENKLAVSFNPFALVAIDYTALFGLDYKVATKLYTSTEVGYIFASDYISGVSAQDGKGFIIRPSLKWFIADNNRFYLQPQIYYKQVTHKMYGWVGKNPVNGVASYEELQDFRYRREISGFNLVSGFVLPLDKNRRGYLDFYFGIGLKNKKSMVVEPNTVFHRLQGMFQPADDGVFPSLPVGARIILAIQ